MPVAARSVSPAGQLDLQDLFDRVERNPMAAVGASGGVIGHQIDRRIGQPQFTRQHGFGHRRHADQIGPVTLKAINLRRRFQARPLGHGIDGGVTDRYPGPCCRLDQALTQSGIVGVGEVDMPDGNGG